MMLKDFRPNKSSLAPTIYTIIVDQNQRKAFLVSGVILTIKRKKIYILTIWHNWEKHPIFNTFVNTSIQGVTPTCNKFYSHNILWNIGAFK